MTKLEATNKKISNECHKLVDSLEKQQKVIAELEKELEKKIEQIEALNKDKDYFSDALDKQIEATYKVVEENNELKTQLQRTLGGNRKMTKDELKQRAEEYANNEVPFDTTESGEKLYTKYDVQQAYIAGATENGIVWHDLRKDPNDLPKVTKEYLTNIGVMDFTSLHDRHLWATLLCEACDYYEEVTDEVIAWCEIPTFDKE